MPKIVDHEQRRARILEGLVRVAGRRGIHAVTMRSVATEAGVSLRLVQYYFQTKARLMHAALLDLERQSHERWAARLARLPQPPSPRAFVEAFVDEALPSDEDSRVFHLVWTSYAVLAMTDPELAEQPFVDGPNQLERQLVDVLKRAQADGLLAGGLDARLEAARLLTLTHGLGTSVLIGQRTVSAATRVLRYHLDHLFGRSDRAQPTTASTSIS
ncbi:TetR/AcrR family transcriptional regulator [Enhygromyxa salina]|uniref:HTH-type transcriptional regulator BetI n=1 Tax=Enhygromyxa salina TaxID=215803 RepID=A0A2S9XTI5_9BACT|nr:TetR/AcrR family transcriptional regulator [Enhygromyxa salina]PRP96050.1 HTH-type transcriptional regulator BetI [Enhygromyxa salina]